MAGSCYEYVKGFEDSRVALHECWIVIRLDGRGFSKFAHQHNFVKPSENRSLLLLTACAEHVMQEYHDIILAYGQSDEYSRREENFFKDEPLKYPPSFDARLICYPNTKTLKDYIAWRQVDCHINNQYNYCFWYLVQHGNLSHKQAHKQLQGSTSATKNELLFSMYGINYNTLPPLHRKGTTLLREKPPLGSPSLAMEKGIDHESTVNASKASIEKKGNPNQQRPNVLSNSASEKAAKGNKENPKSSSIVTLNVDMIRETFWKSRPYILGDAP